MLSFFYRYCWYDSKDPKLWICYGYIHCNTNVLPFRVCAVAVFVTTCHDRFTPPDIQGSHFPGNHFLSAGNYQFADGSPWKLMHSLQQSETKGKSGVGEERGGDFLATGRGGLFRCGARHCKLQGARRILKRPFPGCHGGGGCFMPLPWWRCKQRSQMPRNEWGGS